MGLRDYKKHVKNSSFQREDKENEFWGRMGGYKELSGILERSPYAFVKLAGECLSRVQHLPVFPSERTGMFKRQENDPKERYIRKYLQKTMALAGEVSEAGRSGDPLKFLERAIANIEWSLLEGLPEPDSPIFWGAQNFNHAIKWLFLNNFDSFGMFIFKSIFGAVILGFAESAEFSKSLEDFVLDEVAKIKAERAADPGSLEGASMPRVSKAHDTEQAFALLDQLDSLIESNPSIVPDLRPRLSESMGLVEQYRPASTERDLNARQAGRRIGISHVQVLRLLEERRLGARDAEGKPRFSEKECDDYRDSERKRGPKVKESDDGS